MSPAESPPAASRSPVAPVSPEVEARLAPFLSALRADALRQKISEATLGRALAGLSLDPEVIDKLENQPELVSAPWDYIGRRVSEISNSQTCSFSGAFWLAEGAVRTPYSRKFTLKWCSSTMSVPLM